MVDQYFIKSCISIRFNKLCLVFKSSSTSRNNITHTHTSMKLVTSTQTSSQHLLLSSILPHHHHHHHYHFKRHSNPTQSLNAPIPYNYQSITPNSHDPYTTLSNSPQHSSLVLGSNRANTPQHNTTQHDTTQRIQRLPSSPVGPLRTPCSECRS